MEFGPVTLDKAEGAVLAHSLAVADGRIAKGRVLAAADIARLRAAGFDEITVARLGPQDVTEDEGAARLAARLAGAGNRAQGAAINVSAASTGRVNFLAPAIGLARIDRGLLRRFNEIDEGLTLATVQHNQLLDKSQMLATLKIIPFALPEAVIQQADSLLQSASLIDFVPLASTEVALIQTQIDPRQAPVLAATEKVTRQRLERLGSHLTDSNITRHQTEPLAAAIASALANGAGMILICGASAVMDRRDIIPSAIEAAGGQIDRLGLPVDPGNLLLLGRHGQVPIIGMPGCARSPRLNGFDWVLHLLLAGIEPADKDIADMAHGGLLMEIASRPLPRRLVTKQPRQDGPTAGLLLAAGSSKRMGGQNKMLAELDGTALIRHAALALSEAGLADIVVVTGPDHDAIAGLLADLPVRLVANPDYQTGQASSLKAGLAALRADTPDLAAVLIALGDMPFVTGDLVSGLITAHQGLADSSSRITLPSFGGRRGHPVIWGRSFFDDLSSLSGDQGGRPLLAHYPAALNALSWPDASIHRDIDTPEALAAARKS